MNFTCYKIVLQLNNWIKCRLSLTYWLPNKTALSEHVGFFINFCDVCFQGSNVQWINMRAAWQFTASEHSETSHGQIVTVYIHSINSYWQWSVRLSCTESLHPELTKHWNVKFGAALGRTYDALRWDTIKHAMKVFLVHDKGMIVVRIVQCNLHIASWQDEVKLQSCFLI